MKTRTKIAIWIITAFIVIVIGAVWFFFSYSPGGMRPTYPAKDNDPRLLAIAQHTMPIIVAIETYRNRTGKTPLNLADAGISTTDQESIAYTIEADHYLLWIRLGWDPSLVFNSKDRSWTFEPGDGSPEKRIKLDAKSMAAASAGREP
ncbi:MAG: hypothetical protein WC708_04415 [Lentisphaeria bacterium]